jgi:hypothetical protein
LETTRTPEAFISMMIKLADQNLADRAPHPLVKFFFLTIPLLTTGYAWPSFFKVFSSSRNNNNYSN